MRSPSKALMFKVGMIVFAFAVCVGATAINVRQAGPEAESSPAAASISSFMPGSVPALW